jgi:phospholipid/cholesterol/gamma-HCH transport system substrate-binding protein
MMRRNVIETVMGGVVLIVAALFVFFAYTTAQVRSAPGYAVSASFGQAGGISVGNDVRISGIKVGNVSARALDPHTYVAEVTLSINNNVALPDDTIASIASEGPLGGRYIRLEPGASSTMIAHGGSIKETRGFRSLEDQVGEIIFLATSKPNQAK